MGEKTLKAFELWSVDLYINGVWAGWVERLCTGLWLCSVYGCEAIGQTIGEAIEKSEELYLMQYKEGD